MGRPSYLLAVSLEALGLWSFVALWSKAMYVLSVRVAMTKLSVSVSEIESGMRSNFSYVLCKYAKLSLYSYVCWIHYKERFWYYLVEFIIHLLFVPFCRRYSVSLINFH